MGIQHLLIIIAYELDGYNCQLRKVVRSRDFKYIGQHHSRQTDSIITVEFISSHRTLRNKKFIYWFFTSIIKEFQRDRIIAREGIFTRTETLPWSFLVFPVKHQLRRSKNLQAFRFLSQHGTGCAERVFRRKQKATVWEQRLQGVDIQQLLESHCQTQEADFS